MLNFGVRETLENTIEYQEKTYGSKNKAIFCSQLKYKQAHFVIV